MLTFEQEVDLAQKLDIWSIPTSELKFVDLRKEGLPSTYVYEPIKGGKQIIVGNDWKVLSFPSSLSLEKVLDDIKHHGLWDRAVSVKISLK